MPDQPPPGPLGPKAFLVLLLLFLLAPMICIGGCSLVLSLLQSPPAAQADDGGD
ncbi:MAG: hypothetical protein RIC55_17400 [Pirellulaceae bacterium]